MPIAQTLRAELPVASRTQRSTVRRATGADADALSNFATRTFIETYADYPDPANLMGYALEAFAPVQQSQELADPRATTLLAFRDDALCGFARICPGDAPACVRAGEAIELQRLYVDRRWHGAGVGQELLAQAHEIASHAGGDALWLKVWERNERAIAFYRKSGFVDAGHTDFFVRSDRLTDRVLVMNLPPS